MNFIPNPVIITLKQNQPNKYESSYQKDSQKTIFKDGHQWTEITYIKDHHLLWQFGCGLAAFVATVGTLFIGLFLLEDIQNLWKKALSGKEIVIVNKEEVKHIDKLFKTKNPNSDQNKEPVTIASAENINPPPNDLENNKKEDQKQKTLDLENHKIDEHLVYDREESKSQPKQELPPAKPENAIPADILQGPNDDEPEEKKPEVLIPQPQKEPEAGLDLLLKIQPKEEHPVIKYVEEVLRVPTNEFLQNYMPTEQDIQNMAQNSLAKEDLSLDAKNKIQDLAENPLMRQNFLNFLKWQKLPPIFEFDLPKCNIKEKMYLLHPEERKKQEQTKYRLYSFDFSETISKFKTYPYAYWLGKNGVEKPEAFDFNLEQKDFNNLLETVEKRVGDYYIDPFLKIGERMEMIEKTLPQFFLCIQIQDFEEAWQESGLRIALLTKEEFSSLKDEQVNTLNVRQKELYEKRKALQRK